MKSIHLMKNVGTIYPPRNRQVRFTLKSPSPIYPQIACTINPPPEIAKSYLPSNRLYDLPSNRLCRFTPPEIAKSDLPSNRLYDLPSNRLWRSPRNCQVRLTLKSSVRFTLKSSLAICPPQIAKFDLPSNRLWRFTSI